MNALDIEYQKTIELWNDQFSIDINNDNYTKSTLLSNKIDELPKD